MTPWHLLHAFLLTFKKRLNSTLQQLGLALTLSSLLPCVSTWTGGGLFRHLSRLTCLRSLALLVFARLVPRLFLILSWASPSLVRFRGPLVGVVLVAGFAIATEGPSEVLCLV